MSEPVSAPLAFCVTDRMKLGNVFNLKILQKVKESIIVKAVMFNAIRGLDLCFICTDWFSVIKSARKKSKCLRNQLTVRELKDRITRRLRVLALNVEYENGLDDLLESSNMFTDDQMNQLKKMRADVRRVEFNEQLLKMICESSDIRHYRVFIRSLVRTDQTYLKKLIYKSDEDFKKLYTENNTTVRMSEYDTYTLVAGVTVVDDKIFVVLYNGSRVHVYNSNNRASLPDIKVSGMKNAVGIAGCSHNNVLYISDWELKSIHKVSLADRRKVKRWKVGKKCRLHGLSVTSQYHVLVTATIKGTSGYYTNSKIVEFTEKGQLIQEILLDSSFLGGWQTLELSTDRFIISHGVGDSQHRVCVINSEGQILKCFGSGRGGGEGQLHGAKSIAIDNIRKVVFVGDKYNNRVVMLDYEMNYLGLVQSRVNLPQPSSLYFNLDSDQLIVGLGIYGYNGAVILRPGPDRSITL